MLHTYTPSPEADLLLLRWWDQLVVQGELVPAFGPRMLSLSTFFQTFQPPTLCLLGVEAVEQRLWFVAWVEPALSGGLFCLWVAPEKRQSKQMIAAGVDALEACFQHYPVLLAATADPRLALEYQKIGCTPLGTVPQLFGDRDVETLYLTKADFITRILPLRQLVTSTNGEEARNG